MCVRCRLCTVYSIGKPYCQPTYITYKTYITYITYITYQTNPDDTPYSYLNPLRNLLYTAAYRLTTLRLLLCSFKHPFSVPRSFSPLPPTHLHPLPPLKPNLCT